MSAGMDRRSLLKGIGGSVALGAVGPGMLAMPGCRAGAPLEAALASCVADAAAARAVGVEVLATFGPTPPSAEELVDTLCASARAEWEAHAERNPSLLFAALCERHTADFAEGRVRSVRGWVLSETEARLAALVARSRASSA